MGIGTDFSVTFYPGCTFQWARLQEVPSLILGSSSRPADIFLHNWKRGHPTPFDVTLISSMQQQTIQGGANTPDFAQEA